MPSGDELEVLVDLRRIHRQWVASLGTDGLRKAANRSRYRDSWADPDWAAATPDMEDAFGERVAGLQATLDALLTDFTLGVSACRINEDTEPRPPGYGPTRLEVERNAKRRIDGLSFFITARGKMAEALFLEHEPSHQFFVRDEQQWTRLPEGLAHVVRHIGLVEVTVDAVTVWDADYSGGYAYLGEFAPLRLHPADTTRWW
ncbi:hypothetical protein [Sinomonas sp. B1-1]|uniref:hypothetical protein n=1 Tax=Sinomonas sp. B1-1 TaxID=3141454 RepID=UPI003D2DC2A9